MSKSKPQDDHILSSAVTVIGTASQPCDFMLQATSPGFGNIQEESEESESEESELV